MYIYNSEKKKCEHQLKLQIDGKSETKSHLLTVSMSGIIPQNLTNHGNVIWLEISLKHAQILFHAPNVSPTLKTKFTLLNFLVSPAYCAQSSSIQFQTVLMEMYLTPPTRH